VIFMLEGGKCNIMNDSEKATAIAMFEKGFCCSQAVLATFSEKFNLDRDIALKLSDGFGGGMGRMALTCGAVTGAFMVIGLKYGRTSADDKEAKEKTTQLVQKFIKKFTERNKSISCKELLGCDISTDEGYEYAKKNNLINTLCPKFVADATEILEEIL